ncbi:MAG: sigma-54-dependent Fis family transcriptional regulator [Nitrospinae bacterium]|nr:sigma-54-dependent Fis family transcriptional regulator [Nitrospinota bacterium]
MSVNERIVLMPGELSGEFLKEALDGIRDSIKIIDREYRVIYANRAGLLIAGQPLAKLAREGKKCFEAFYNSEVECSYCVVTQTFNTGQPAFNTFTANIGGETRFKEVSVFPLTDPSGKVDRVIEIIRDVTDLRRDLSATEEFSNIISRDEKMSDVFRLMESVAPTSSTVLIFGETGTGKELVARAIHQASKRAGKKFVAINCGALTDTLLETELFGHEKGAFTGAEQRRIGKFELADKGTLFLDEIGNISPAMQVKILRALQEGEITRVGGNDTIKVDVRYICATNLDLKEAVRKGGFREDLYYRINVVPIHLPPLRERAGDIKYLAEHYLQKFSRDMGKNIAGFSAEALERMKRYSWPGNIRELGNLVERAVILTRGPVVEKVDIPQDNFPPKTAEPGSGALELQDVVAQAEKKYLLESLKSHHWNITETARAAGVNARTIHRKMKEFGINRED